MQSYPVFALAFAAIVERIGVAKWRIAFYVLCAYMLCVNLFQITQYRTTTLHYDEMNRRYYAAIYLNPHPTPLDMDLLDSDEQLHSEQGFQTTTLIHTDTATHLHVPNGGNAILYETDLAIKDNKDTWLKFEGNLKVDAGQWRSYIVAAVKTGDSVKQTKIRLYNAISLEGKDNPYIFYMQVPSYFAHSHLNVHIDHPFDFTGTLTKFRVTLLEK